MFSLRDYSSLFVVLAEGLGEVGIEDVVGVVGANVDAASGRPYHSRSCSLFEGCVFSRPFFPLECVILMASIIFSVALGMAIGIGLGRMFEICHSNLFCRGTRRANSWVLIVVA